ncbi:MAG TPA: family 78 glycoside hydrolase catalytic domain [Bacteroidales bacterium]|nr:family 78 glycoside hydrolase catalytic domain [Bacteroidales bacterium]
MNKVIALFLLLLIINSCTIDPGKGLPGNLKCEYIVNPVGIDMQRPRFTWNLNDERRGARQTAFRIFIGTDSAEVANGKGMIWSSGKVSSGITFYKYDGPYLKPFTKYYWSIRLWGQARKRTSISDVASFETGMMNISNWHGYWISDTRDINLKEAPYFRKTFIINGKIKSARQYIAATGLYELYINGIKTDDSVLDPAFTRYDRRVLYTVHDITSLLHEGENTTGVLLGNGWYNHQSRSDWMFHKAQWRARPSFCSDIRITFEDGTTRIISTSDDWKTDLSPVLFNNVFTGEKYDFSKEQAGWNNPGFNDSRWKNSIIVPAPSAIIAAQVMPKIRAGDLIPAVRLRKPDYFTWIFDLGKNIAGNARITVSGYPGTAIYLRYAERLRNGRADIANINTHYRYSGFDDPFQTDIIILSGKGKETFYPRFSYKGFRYVEVTSVEPLSLTKESLSGYSLNSDVQEKGLIRSSNPLLNQIWFITSNSYLSNLMGYPTASPNRDKVGWTASAHIAIETGLYNYDGITLYEKWIRDHLDEQQPNGALPSIMPSPGWGYAGDIGPAITSSLAIIPWNIYLFYGDKTILEESYQNIKRYIDFTSGLISDGLIKNEKNVIAAEKTETSSDLISSVYFYADVEILSKIARALNNDSDNLKYRQLADTIKNAINNAYFDSIKCIYGAGRQTELSIPLYWGVVPANARQKVADNLAKDILNNKKKMDVDMYGSKAILNVLSNFGYADLAYDLAVSDKYPSWGWWIANGATALYENWEIGYRTDRSMNTIMYGEISAWMYKALGGILPDEGNAGFKNIILKPHFVTGLDYFEAIHTSPYGKIVSSWRRAGDKIIYDVSVPAGSTATLTLNASEILEGNRHIHGNRYVNIDQNSEHNYSLFLKSGNYSFTITESKY